MKFLVLSSLALCVVLFSSSNALQEANTKKLRRVANDAGYWFSDDDIATLESAVAKLDNVVKAANTFKDIANAYKKGTKFELIGIFKCPDDYPEEQASLCYKPCVKGDWAFVKGVGPVCWGCPSSHPSEEAGLCYRNCPSDKPHKSTYNCFGNCPSGYRNDGLTCFRDAHIYIADNSRCKWYDMCGLTFDRGCSKCASGYRNDGCTCRRDAHLIWRPNHNRGVGIPLRSYGRGVGVVMQFRPQLHVKPLGR